MEKAKTMYKKTNDNRKSNGEAIYSYNGNLQRFCEEFLMREIESYALLGNDCTKPIRVPYYLDVFEIKNYLSKYGYEIEISIDEDYFRIHWWNKEAW